MLVSFFVSPGVGLFVDNVFREDKCKSLAIAVTGITVFVLVICLASLVKGLSFAIEVLWTRTPMLHQAHRSYLGNKINPYQNPTNYHQCKFILRVDHVSLVNMHFISNYKNILFWCPGGHFAGNIPRIRFWKSVWHFCYVCRCRIFYCKQGFSSRTQFCLCSLHSSCTYHFNFFLPVLFIQISSKKICLNNLTSCNI